MAAARSRRPHRPRGARRAGLSRPTLLAVGILREAVQQIAAQADSYRSGSDFIAIEFWRGFEDGFDD